MHVVSCNSTRQTSRTVEVSRLGFENKLKSKYCYCNMSIRISLQVAFNFVLTESTKILHSWFKTSSKAEAHSDVCQTRRQSICVELSKRTKFRSTTSDCQMQKWFVYSNVFVLSGGKLAQHIRIRLTTKKSQCVAKWQQKSDATQYTQCISTHRKVV